MNTPATTVEHPVAETNEREASAMGRPRDDERTTAILDATGELLMRDGFDRLRIQDIADCAGCGTGAIYRRWETKEDLIADAIRAFPDPNPELTDDPAADLRTLVHDKFEAVAANPDLITGLIAAMRTEQQIADAVHSRFTVPVFEGMLARMLGDDHPQLALLAETMPGVIVHRAAFEPGPVDLDELIDDFLALVDAVR